MVIAKQDSLTPQQLADRLLAERETIVRFVQVVERLERTVREYESRYGIDSEDIAAAIDHGRLMETTEVCDWIFDYELLLRAKAVAS